ncbi:PEP-CTERM sorting domain-containing protein [Nostoc sp. CHAB 5844]|nr:PEP-CTERM sorting domain-containing protein [Nostoc sp. CHAB 5844]
MVKTFLNKIAVTSAIAPTICASILIVSGYVASSPVAAATFASDVTSARFGSLVDDSDVTVNGVTYLNQSLAVTGVRANSTDWLFGSNLQPVVTLRRGGYIPADDFGNYNNRQLILSEGIPELPTTTVRIPQPTTTQAVLNQNNVLQGAENLFVNAGNTGAIQELQTDIERADFVFQSGVTTSANHATVFFDRGLFAAHDGFQIAPILSIDTAGNPTSYGSLISIATGWGGTNLRPGGDATDNLPYPELTNSTGEFRVVNAVNQQVGGILLPLYLFSDTPTTIYGYSLFAPDVNDGSNPNNLLDWTNATFFPQNTPNATGGLDLLAGSGQIATAVPEPSTILGSLVFGSVFAAFKRQRKFS